MKKLITTVLTLSLFFFVSTFTSCKENPVDKQLDNFEAVMARIDKAFNEKNPSGEEIIAFKKDLADFHESFMDFERSTRLVRNSKDYQLTDGQTQRLSKIIRTGQSISYFPIHEDLKQMARLYNLSY